MAGKVKADGTPVLRRRTVPAVARELLVYSGNECAWDGCGQRLLTPEKGWVGVVAHIIGAEVGSARHEHWDGQDLDALRAPGNLFLLCATHSVLIDSPGSRNEFTVEYLRALKSRHEEPYRYGVDQLTQQMEAEFRDAVASNDGKIRRPTTMRRYFGWAGQGLSPVEEAEEIALFNKLVDELATLTRKATQVLSLVVKDDEPDCDRIERRLNVTPWELESISEELNEIEAAFLDRAGHGDGLPRIRLRGGVLNGVPEIWEQLREFGKAQKLNLDVIFVDLDFSVLD
ncbi:hypothetical protein [Streptacidiphilus fuscans]|uniref:HNH endonuclease n=1 Tax=Streptacidiphilus fuscans TaxID=2789292 RepID=A0A931FIF5_9ACTN|nr:hypothetical protein [Streptacidiphilus fuscans]MBF9071734.1 hypothetical protein [Streptacidiphilus fuscans]